MVNPEQKTVYHVMSRTALDGFPFKDVEKDEFVSIIKRFSQIYFTEILGFSRHGRFDISYLIKMIRLIKNKDINIVHSYFSPACHMASFAAWVCGVKGIFRTIQR